MPLQSNSVPEWEARGWHGFLLDDGCTLWDKCAACPLPVCTEDIGHYAARREAIAAGLTPMNRPRKSVLLETPVQSDDDYAERVLRFHRLGKTQDEIAEAIGIHRRVVRRIYESAGVGS